MLKHLCSYVQVGNENQAFFSKWIDSHADACKSIGKPFVLEEFGKNVTAKAKTPEEWKARRTPMFSHAYSEYISSLESGGNYQGALHQSEHMQCMQCTACNYPLCVSCSIIF